MKDRFDGLVELRSGESDGELVALVNPEYVSSVEPIRWRDVGAMPGLTFENPGGVIGYRVRMASGNDYCCSARSGEQLMPRVRRAW